MKCATMFPFACAEWIKPNNVSAARNSMSLRSSHIARQLVHTHTHTLDLNGEYVPVARSRVFLWNQTTTHTPFAVPLIQRFRYSYTFIQSHLIGVF